MLLKKPMGLILVIGLSFFVCSCGKKGLVIGQSTLPDSFNPVLEQNLAGLNVNELLYDGLVNFEIDPANGVMYSEFALAKNIEQSEVDKKTYTIYLNEKATWHDGRKVTTSDVLYSYRAYTTKDNKSPSRDYIMSFIADVRPIDDTTLDIVFKEPLPPFRAYPVLTFKIIPEFYEGKKMNVEMRSGSLERKFATKPIGSGPFSVSKIDIGRGIEFKRNENYFKTRPNAAYIQIKRIIDPEIRLNELNKGNINLILETSPTDRQKVSLIDNLDINSYMPFAFYQIDINTKRFPDVKERKAMALALDKQNLVPGITDDEDLVIINNGPYPSNLFSTNIPEYYSDPMPATLLYDEKQASNLASKSGLINKNPILIYPDSMGEFGDALAKGFAKQLSEIGVKIEVRKLANKVYKKSLDTREYDLALRYYEGFDNLYSTLSELYTSHGIENVTQLKDSTVDDLFKKLATENVTSKWIDLILKTDARLCELCPALYLCCINKDVYSRGISQIIIGSDNPFLSVEYWVF